LRETIVTGLLPAAGIIRRTFAALFRADDLISLSRDSAPDVLQMKIRMVILWLEVRRNMPMQKSPPQQEHIPHALFSTSMNTDN